MGNSLHSSSSSFSKSKDDKKSHHKKDKHHHNHHHHSKPKKSNVTSSSMDNSSAATTVHANKTKTQSPPPPQSQDDVTMSDANNNNNNNNKNPKAISSGPSAASFDRSDKPANTTPDNNSLQSSFAITGSFTDVRSRYHIDPKEVGHGHYGVVRKCQNRETKEWYAIKSIRKSKVGRIFVLKREIELLKEVDHPNIIDLVDVYEDEKYLHLVTELCTGGELFDRIIAKTQSPEGHFSEGGAAELVRCILSAIAYCHDVKDIVHRDLKPENFLYVSEEEDAAIKIIDFGLSRHDTPGKKMHTKVGTPYYVAPEVLDKNYTKKCDVWSIGVITYILLCGYPPFYGDSDTEIFESVRTGYFDFPSPEWDTISNEAKDFICSLLKADPEERPSASEALKHKWIKSQSSDKLHADKGSERGMSFRRFMGQKKFFKETLDYLVANLTEADIGKLGEVFHALDTNNDGSISLAELDEALAQGNIAEELRDKHEKLRVHLSLAHEDKIEWKVYLKEMTDKAIMAKEDKVRMAFDQFHSKEKSKIDITDLKQHFGSDAIAEEIMGDLDVDGDGCISYEKFRKMVTDNLSERN